MELSSESLALAPVKLACPANPFFQVHLGFEAEQFTRFPYRRHAEFDVNVVFPCKDDWGLGPKNPYDSVRQPVNSFDRPLVAYVERLAYGFGVAHGEQDAVHH